MRPRVAVVHPRLVPGGGSEACAMWTAQALRGDHEVTLITTGRPDLAALDRSCGTSLDGTGLAVRTVALPPGTRTRFDALRGFRLARYCRRHAREFEVMISAYNVMDFGVPGIQRIADFSFDDALRRELHIGSGAAGTTRQSPPARAQVAGSSRTCPRRLGRPVPLPGLSQGPGRRDAGRLETEPHRGQFRMDAPPARRAFRRALRGRLSARHGVLARRPGVGTNARTASSSWAVSCPRRASISSSTSSPGSARSGPSISTCSAARSGPRTPGRSRRCAGATATGSVSRGRSTARRRARSSPATSTASRAAAARPSDWPWPRWSRPASSSGCPTAAGRPRSSPIRISSTAIPAGPPASILGALEDPARRDELRRHLEIRAAAFSADRFAAGMRAVVRDFLKDTHGRP